MKSFVALTVFALSLCATVSASGQSCELDACTWSDGFIPQQPSVSKPGYREWAWDGKDGLGVSVPATVHYERGGPARIVITGPEDTLTHLRVGQGQIRHDNSRDLFREGRLEITVSGVTLRAVMLAGSPTIELGRLDQDRLSLAINGSGVAGGEGRVDQVKLAIHGSGKADFGGVTARRADISIAGSGTVSVGPREAANIAITGSGIVRLTARPAELHRAITGSGDIRVVD
ncbi:MAG: hypothetical protein BGN85_14310 [Alphaproteobacteria bacterium 64-11]|nr:DUF2807 domain-containing protein [Alphaproteobacteria bacterium]OJU11145.1 MAG: hypothetical protein BGN85_14310 [Alphaproteobacteria bacterium 64-11]